jgi:hypothetical protein
LSLLLAIASSVPLSIKRETGECRIANGSFLQNVRTAAQDLHDALATVRGQRSSPGSLKLARQPSTVTGALTLQFLGLVVPALGESYTSISGSRRAQAEPACGTSFAAGVGKEGEP